MIRTTALVTLCWLASGCGDNSDPNLPPELVEPAITMTMAEDTPITVNAAAIDPERGNLTYSASQPQHGTLTGTGPEFTYTPDANYAGTDSFTVTISDGINTIHVPVNLMVTAVDDAPVAPDVQLTTNTNADLAITLAATDVDSTALIYAVVSPPAHGTLSGPLPNVTYTPDAGYAGDDSFTYKASDGTLDSNTATVAISVLGPRCGDGIVQFELDELCDDGNTTPGDGCDASCQEEPFVSVPPVMISAALSCTTAVANTAHKVAADTSGNIYAVMLCGTSADAVVSTDRGNSYSTPVDLAADLPNAPVNVVNVAVSSGPSGMAYAVLLLDSGDVYLRTTTDKGATWSPGALLGTASTPDGGLSIESFNNDVFVAFAVESGVEVAANHARGAGAFTSVTTAMTGQLFHLVYDVIQGSLAIATDTPTFHVRVSSDLGATFPTEVASTLSEYFSDWAYNNGILYVSGVNVGFSGNSMSLYVLSPDLSQSSQLGGLPIVSTAQTRTVAASVIGDGFVASELDGGGVELDHVFFGDDAFDGDPRDISDTGGSPGITALPGLRNVALVYTDGTSVFATVQVFVDDR